MKCPKCQFENPDGAKFCIECGDPMEFHCPKCGVITPSTGKFCLECGHKLDEAVEIEKEVTEAKGERKHVTVLFSDMSGYTAMSERLDPEEVKETTSRIFGEISQIVSKYDGLIEKFIGDAVMAIFGATKAYEDDPIRAIKAAREIHRLVESLSPKYEERIGQFLSMHTGINTGLVVTGEVDLEKGTHGIAGDTINLAARLSSLGKEGDILVGPNTYTQAEGYFDFETLEPTKVKGKAKPIQVYRVLSQKDQPRKVHRLQGVRARLIGRKVEIAQLKEAVDSLRNGKGSTFAICGTAGTGKSRLVEEFKATLDLKEIQWRQGHAYPYAQNIPYFPLINLLNWAFQIEEGDPPEKVRAKIETGIAYLLGEEEEIFPYVGSLYALSYPEIDDVSPEFWKSKLQKAIQSVLSAMAQRGPTVICLEDLHWADPSSLELLRLMLSDFRDPILFLCVYRPIITVFTSHQINAMASPYHEIRLQDLSPSESQDMVESLLNTENVPPELRRFVQEKVEGNPFYLEEVANSLIESKTLIRDNGGWQVTRPIAETGTSSTIHGVISARLDRLEKETKHILQEASVIGRTFYYEILKKITELKGNIDQHLSGLERLDLIKARSLEPDLEYIFKHALTQEVVYNGLLKKERKEIHDRIGLVMEQLFHDRLPEFYETLAFHFTQGRYVLKAVDYLMKSGEKSLRRFAVEEAHNYFQEGFDILTSKPEKSLEEKRLIIDLIIKWALVFYYRGDIKGWTDLFIAHKELAESVDDRERLGMFYAWLGFSFAGNANKESNYYLRKALEIGEDLENQQIIGYACTWLVWTCSDLGQLDEAILFGERAQEIAKFIKSDHYLYFKSLGGLGHTYWQKGETKKALEAGKALLEYGQRHSNIRSQTMGHFILGAYHNLAGESSRAIQCFQRALEVSSDPLYNHIAKTFMGMGYILNDQIQEAEEPLREAASFCQKYDCDWNGTPAHALLGIVSIAKGHMGLGLRMLEEALQIFIKGERKFYIALTEHIIGKVFFQIVEGAGPISPLTIAKNIGFLVKNAPFADKKAESHFNKAIAVAKDIGANGLLGQVYLDLGLLKKLKRKNDQAKESLSEAIQVFEQCEAEVHLKQAREALASLK